MENKEKDNEELKVTAVVEKLKLFTAYARDARYPDDKYI